MKSSDRLNLKQSDFLFEAQVRDISGRGMGVADHPLGFICFVSGVWPGDIGRFEITQQKKRFAFARLVELVHPSPNRRESPCPHSGLESGSCGGCPWIMASYQDQLVKKAELLRHQVRRHKLDLCQGTLKNIWPSPQEFSYRNRVQLKTDGESIGFVTRESHALAPVDKCLVMTPALDDVFQRVKKSWPNKDWHPPKGSSWMPLELDEKTTISDIHPQYRIPFAQANHWQNERMQTWLHNKLTSTASTKIIELFCGDGNFTTTIARTQVKEVLCVEVVESAIEQLVKKDLESVKTLSANIYKPSSWNRMKRILKQPEVLVLDPPREGFEGLSRFLENFPSIHTILYISCHPDSFLRDVQSLNQAHWRLKELQPVDQFPQTPHLELLGEIRHVEQRV